MKNRGRYGRAARSDLPRDPGAVLRALCACRDTMLCVQRQVRVSGPAYVAAQMVIAAIDAFATLLTGQRSYFGINVAPSNSSCGPKEADLLWDEGQQRSKDDGDDPVR